MDKVNKEFENLLKLIQSGDIDSFVFCAELKNGEMVTEKNVSYKDNVALVGHLQLELTDSFRQVQVQNINAVPPSAEPISSEAGWWWK